MWGLLFCLSAAETATELTITSSRAITIDFQDGQTEFTAFLTEDESIVFVHTLDGFEVTAYDFQGNEIGKFSNEKPIAETGLMDGKIVVKKTGANNQFIFSVFIKNNLPLDMQCQEITVSNDATKSVSLTSTQLESGKVQCIWLAAPTQMTTTINAQVSGNISVFNNTYSEIAELDEGQGQTLSFTSSNSIISFKPSTTGTSVSLSATPTGENFNNVELIKTSHFVPTDLGSFPTLEEQIRNIYPMFVDLGWIIWFFVYSF